MDNDDNGDNGDWYVKYFPKRLFQSHGHSHKCNQYHDDDNDQDNDKDDDDNGGDDDCFVKYFLKGWSCFGALPCSLQSSCLQQVPNKWPQKILR